MRRRSRSDVPTVLLRLPHVAQTSIPTSTSPRRQAWSNLAVAAVSIPLVTLTLWIGWRWIDPSGFSLDLALGESRWLERLATESPRDRNPITDQPKADRLARRQATVDSRWETIEEIDSNDHEPIRDRTTRRR